MKNKSDLKNRLERKHEAKEQLEVLNCQASSTSIKWNSDKNKLIQSRGRVLSLRSSVQRHNKQGENHSRYTDQLEQAESECRNLSEQVDVLEKRMRSINEEREALKNAIAECDTGADFEETKAHQDSLKESRDEVKRLQSLIDEQETALEDYSESEDDHLDELQARREEILASIALGESEDGRQSLDSLDEEIDDIVNDVDGKQKKRLEQYRHAIQTIKGLRSRLEESKERLQELDDMTNGIIEQFLISQAEEISATYIDHAKALADQFSRLKAIDDILMSKAGRQSMTFVPNGWWNMYLPSLLTDTPDSNQPDALFNAKTFSFYDQAEIETERFKEMGLEEFFS